MKKLLLLFLVLAFVGLYSYSKVPKDCTFRGKVLKGKVRIVEVNEDFKVRVVTALEDIRVRQVDNNMFSECGVWQFVNNGFEDFSIKFVETNEDFSIRFVTYTPPGVQ
jgi:hypothetical protein